MQTILNSSKKECSDMKNSEITVAEYLLSRLKEIGVDHLFGVPGDFALGLHKSPCGRGDDEVQTAESFPIPDARPQ
jgi:hypothetical protein